MEIPETEDSMPEITSTLVSDAPVTSTENDNITATDVGATDVVATDVGAEIDTTNGQIVSTDDYLQLGHDQKIGVSRPGDIFVSGDPHVPFSISISRPDEEPGLSDPTVKKKKLNSNYTAPPQDISQPDTTPFPSGITPEMFEEHQRAVLFQQTFYGHNPHAPQVFYPPPEHYHSGQHFMMHQGQHQVQGQHQGQHQVQGQVQGAMASSGPYFTGREDPMKRKSSGSKTVPKPKSSNPKPPPKEAVEIRAGSVNLLVEKKYLMIRSNAFTESKR